MVGAGRIHYACYYLEEAYRQNDLDRVKDYHSLLIEEYIQFVQMARELLAAYHGKLIIWLIDFQNLVGERLVESELVCDDLLIEGQSLELNIEDGALCCL